MITAYETQDVIAQGLLGDSTGLSWSLAITIHWAWPLDPGQGQLAMPAGRGCRASTVMVTVSAEAPVRANLLRVLRAVKLRNSLTVGPAPTGRALWSGS